MSKQWRAAVVGAGVVGEWHIRVLANLPETRLVALCDTDVPRAQAALEKNKITPVPIYSDIGEMLKKEKLDLVHICTPSGYHLEPALAAMNAGVNVVCEKPLEIQLDRIDRLIETAERNKVRLAGIFQNRWNAANRALHDAATEGRFGRIAWAGSFTPWHRTDQYYREGGWRGTWKLDGGGAIMNQSVHAIDLLQWIAGPVKQVSAYASSRIHPEIEVEDTLTCALQFTSGAYGTIMGSTAIFPGGRVRIEVGGEHGYAVSEDGLRVFKFRDERPGDAALLEQINTKKADAGGGSNPQLSNLRLHAQNIQAILKAWEENRDAETNGPEARKAVSIILAMYESAKKNGEPVVVR
jgi:UDP-N-acetyl-2-amino-2-deoxyglucuronate dehydrogenase